MKLFILILTILGLATQASGQPSSSQGPRSVPTTGYVNPTLATYNGSKPMQCTASLSPSAAFIEQNRATWQVALSDAAATGKWILLPPCNTDVLTGLVCPSDDTCGYPVGKKTGVTCGVDFTGLTGITIQGYGAVIRQAAATNGPSEFDMVCLKSTSKVRLLGITWSQRDVHGSTTEQVHAVEIGNGQNTANDVEIYENRFIESVDTTAGNKGGDCIRFLGSTPPSTDTRVVIMNNAFNDCRRSGISFQRGHQSVFVVHNTFEHVTDQMIDYEPTSEGLIGKAVFADNLFNREFGGNSVAVTLTGTNGTSPTIGAQLIDNTFVNCTVTGSLDLAQIWIGGNTIIDDTNSSSSDLYMFRVVWDAWVYDNFIYRGASMATNDMIGVSQEVGSCQTGPTANCLPHDFWITGNRLKYYAPLANSTAAVAIRFNAGIDAWVTENDISYHATGIANPANGFVGVQFVSTTGGSPVGTSSGWVTGNRVKRDLLIDGVTPAGRMLAGVLLQPGATTPTIGHMVVRDNFTDGAVWSVDNLANTLVQIPNGAPVLSGSVAIDVTNGLVPGSSTLYRAENTTDAETVSSGALHPSKHTSYLVDDAAYTLPTCAVDGMIKHIKVKAVTTSGSVTPTNFGDGTSVTWSSGGLGSGGVLTRVEFDLACDLAGGKWWLMDRVGVSVI